MERHAKVMYDPRCDHKILKLCIGMGFIDGFQARDALTDHAVENGWEIHFKMASRKAFEATCKSPCKWFCSWSIVKMNGTVVIKKLEPDHTCPRAMRNKIVTSNWIARKYLHVFILRPEFSCKELGKDLMQRFAFDATKCRLYHSKRKAIDMLRGKVEAHYAKMRSYILELSKSDREGWFELHVDVGAVFKAVYIGFSGLRKGFKEGCRPVIGLDGAFLKTYLGGILLTAVGTDGNNQMYPIAWAVVEAENELCWTWFIKILIEELTLGEGVGITIISDQQNGLENAVQSLLPLAEHRNCARHIYANWKKHTKNVYDYVHEYFSLSKYKLAYGYGLPSLNGEKLWPHA
ncbi:uncharacterized protein LOC121776875 [Salvia splendens]|uniref:uncharacterized protein LOC121776875 n=1 Tax=Salvia splendens TaxID=180675 RepID=UPI001C25F3CD|nr:uncharacterized protein LOC121776875 [Salvia splendens]